MKMGLKNLSNEMLFGNSLMVSPLPLSPSPHYPSLTKDYSKFNDQRFKIPNSKNFKNMNPPSTTIHISNLPESYDLNEIKKLFGTVSMPLGITRFNESTTMALACLDNIDSAIRVITTFHNHPIMGRYLKIAFAKYKLNMMTSGPVQQQQSFGFTGKMSESYHSGTGKDSVYSREYSGGGSYRFTGEQWSAGSGVG
jgi:RNA recognition motif-containing protein